MTNDNQIVVLKIYQNFNFACPLPAFFKLLFANCQSLIANERRPSAPPRRGMPIRGILTPATLRHQIDTPWI